MTNHGILMARAQAAYVSDRVTVALCERALLPSDVCSRHIELRWRRDGARRELQAREHGTAVRS